jgi:prophage regulatory protein
VSSELPRIINKEQLLQIVPYTPQHILRLEKMKQFPQRINIGTRRVGWYLSEVEAWLRARPRTPCAPVMPPPRVE